MSVRISALVVAHNEERHLPECLQTLKFADEIIVVLDRSTDHSYRIAMKQTNLVYEGSWEIEGDRRNFGIGKCSGEWILEIDADERVSPDLASEILEQIKNKRSDKKTDYTYFNIPFDNYIGSKLVKNGWGCYWGVRSAPRLFKKGSKTWESGTIHPSYKISGEGGKMKYSIVHYVDDNISDMIRRFDRYTESNAKQLISKGNQDGFWNNFRRIFSRFFKCYVQRKGFKEGSYGFLNALFAGLYPIVSYLKAKEIIEQRTEK